MIAEISRGEIAVFMGHVRSKWYFSQDEIINVKIGNHVTGNKPARWRKQLTHSGLWP